MKTISTSKARKRFYTLIDYVKETHEPVHIVGKRNTAILLAEEDWRAIHETLYLAKTTGMHESIIKGLRTPIEECYEKSDW